MKKNRRSFACFAFGAQITPKIHHLRLPYGDGLFSRPAIVKRAPKGRFEPCHDRVPSAQPRSEGLTVQDCLSLVDKGNDPTSGCDERGSTQLQRGGRQRRDVSSVGPCCTQQPHARYLRGGWGAHTHFKYTHRSGGLTTIRRPSFAGGASREEGNEEGARAPAQAQPRSAVPSGWSRVYVSNGGVPGG